MGASIKNIYVAYKDNKAPVSFTVHYRDNGYSDTLYKTIDNKTDAIKWLDMWYSDLSGGFQYIEQAKTVVNNLSENRGIIQ